MRLLFYATNLVAVAADLHKRIAPTRLAHNYTSFEAGDSNSETSDTEAQEHPPPIPHM